MRDDKTNGCVGETTLWRRLPRLTLGSSWRTSRQSATKSQLSCWQPALFFRAFFEVFKLANCLNFSSQFSELASHNKDKVRSKWIILSVAFFIFYNCFFAGWTCRNSMGKKASGSNIFTTNSRLTCFFPFTQCSAVWTYKKVIKQLRYKLELIFHTNFVFTFVSFKSTVSLDFKEICIGVVKTSNSYRLFKAHLKL